GRHEPGGAPPRRGPPRPPLQRVAAPPPQGEAGHHRTAAGGGARAAVDARRSRSSGRLLHPEPELSARLHHSAANRVGGRPGKGRVVSRNRWPPSIAVCDATIARAAAGGPYRGISATFIATLMMSPAAYSHTARPASPPAMM